MVRLLCCLFFGCCSKYQNKDIKIRKHILKQVKKGKSIEEVDKSIEMKFGQNAMAYSEIDFWYYRFYNGDHDVKYDRSRDPKPLELSDLPPEMKLKIIYNVRFNDRPNLAKVSQFFESTAYHDINHVIASPLEAEDLEIFKRNPSEYDIEEEMKDMKVLLNTPGLRLKNFDININIISPGADERLEKAVVQFKLKMESLLASLNSPIHSAGFKMDGADLKDFLTFLPFFKPGFLERLLYVNLENISEDYIDTFMKINELEQWSQAEWVDLMVENYEPIITLPVDYFLRFEWVGIWTIIDLKDEKPFKWIRELIMRSPILEVFHIRTQFNFWDFCEFLGSDIDVKRFDQKDGVAVWTIPSISDIPTRVFKIGRHPMNEQHMWINRTDCDFNGEWCREF